MKSKTLFRAQELETGFRIEGFIVLEEIDGSITPMIQKQNIDTFNIENHNIDINTLEKCTYSIEICNSPSCWYRKYTKCSKEEIKLLKK